MTIHTSRPRLTHTVLAESGPCCEAADAVVQSVEGCACCFTSFVLGNLTVGRSEVAHGT